MGSSTGLASQWATAADVGTPLRRIVAASGAVHQVHIIDGVLTRPPTMAPPRAVRRFITLSSQRRGSSAWMAALINRAAVRAFQTARP